MDSSLVEVLDESWWKLILVIGAIVIATVAIKVAIKFDLNKWLEQRSSDRKRKEHLKVIEECRHGWTLLHNSHYSVCGMCHAYIATAVLLAALEYADDKPFILGEHYTMVIKSTKGIPIVNDYIGNREDQKK